MSKGRTAGTLVALGVIVALMLVLGWQAVSAPFPSLSGGGGGGAVACQKVQKKVRIFRKEITVSVFNGTKRKGLADLTMRSMERRAFNPGAVGNAPPGGTVAYVEVRSTTSADDPAAQLVAQQFKPAAKVVLSADALGPGIVVVLGPKFKAMHVPAPKSLKLAKPKRTCLDNASPAA
ncbi:MAG: LytR C-terminal domain-containing protein [Actinomycetota bacterium]|nr:LytR C-terminal domain-containing protein [Actinomycetota bacterium]